ncbi:MAG: membrane protein insertion efficiency factor YidD [Agromyces sp.]
MTFAARLFGWVLLAPRNAIIAILRVYQFGISPIYGDVCRYYPSCSHYALDAVARYGVLVGGVLATRRLFRCHPWARGGIDDVPPRRREWTHRTRAGFVAPGLK